jgi:cell division septum initiation protein DivIVA
MGSGIAEHCMEPALTGTARHTCDNSRRSSMPDQSSAATEHAILQEITAPLEALPDDPLSVIDADFATTLRGYDRVAVDEYVHQTRRLVAEMQATRSPEAAVRRALERVGEQISGILQRAHDTAEQITAQSRSEAEDRMEQARAEADQIMTAAEERVRDLDADTDRIWLERQRIVADAEDLAAQLLGVAKTAAERFPTDDENAEDVPVLAADEDTDDIERDAGIDDDSDAGEMLPFTPLDRSRDDETAVLGEDETAVLHDPEPGAPTDSTEPAQPQQADPADPSRAPRTPGQGSSVIRPASQAANRRLDR